MTGRTLYPRNHHRPSGHPGFERSECHRLLSGLHQKCRVQRNLSHLAGNAIRANVYAQISYALNRVYTEWYRSRGYDFDITNSTRYDQAFVQNRDIYDNVSDIVDEIFNNYVRRQGSVEPYFTQYCNGTTVTCDGLSQWGTVPLAEQGYTPYQILTNYYGDDIEIVTNAPVRINAPSYPGCRCASETPATTCAASRFSSTASPTTTRPFPKSIQWTGCSVRRRRTR